MHDSQTIAGCGVQATVENQPYKLGVCVWLMAAGVTIESQFFNKLSNLAKRAKP
jgi:cation transport ATPase